jgi:ABC-type glycerol-3-phosphate transport system substrate-binding protein
MKRIALVLFALLLAAGFSFANGSQENTGAAQKIEISWQVWVTPNLTRDFWDGIAAAYEQQNPNTTVKIIEANANVTPAADDFIKTRLASGDVPDLWWNATVSFFADGGQLWALPQDDPDLKKVKNLSTALYKGKLYAIPFSIQPQGLMYYNKSLWAKAGLTTTPTTWAEFEADCQKLKDAGITPIITGGDWVAGYAFVTFTSPEIYHNDLQWYTDRWAGKVHFTDANYVEAANWFNGLATKGYFNKGALSLSYPQVEQQFLTGAGAIYPMGSWFTAAEAAAKKDFDVGVFFSPTKDGKAHLLQSLSYGTGGTIYAKSQHPEEAYKLMKFAELGSAYGSKLIQADGLYSNLDPPLTYPMSPLQTALGKLITTAPTTSGMYNLLVGSAPPAGLNAIYDKVGQTILAGGVTDVKPLMQQLDDFWNKANKQ